MAKQTRMARILAADIGSTTTHVCLLDNIEGRHRLVARGEALTTSSEADLGIMSGLVQAIRQIEHAVQSPLLDANNELISPEPPDRRMPVIFCVTSSAAPPVRVLILGLSNTFSIPSARRACQLPVVELAGALELDLAQQGDHAYWSSLYDLNPEVIVLVGGFDTTVAGTLEIGARRLLSFYSNPPRDQRPIVIFSGNQTAVQGLTQSLSPSFDFRSVLNIRPNPNSERLGDLRRELVHIYEQTKLSQMIGYRRLLKWCSAPPRATCGALENLFRFLASQSEPDQVVMGIDVGASNTLLFSQAGASASTLFGIHEGAGHYHGDDDDAIRRWLPLAIANENAMLRVLRNPSPVTPIPIEMPASLAALGAAHEAILENTKKWQDTLDSSDPTASGCVDRLYARGGVFMHTTDKALGLLTLLDALQPVGITQIVLDWAEMWPQLGAVAAVAPQAAVEVLEQDGLSLMGTIISPIGLAANHGQALFLTITHANGQCESHSIPGGIVKRFVFPKNEILTIKVQTSPRWNLGYNRGRNVEVQVRSGALGVIIDTRGRPLSYSKLGLLWRTRIDADIQTLTSPIRMMYSQSTLKRGQRT
ncbi:MAG: glutamate mutase L [Anaerolineae bacterium]